MKCTVEKVDGVFSDAMYFFDMELPDDDWEDFLSDFKETIGHEKNTRYSYFSSPPKAPKKGWYLCKARAEKARIWILIHYDDVIWCGETLKTGSWRQEKAEWDNSQKKKENTQSSNFNDFISVGLSPEMEFMQAVLGDDKDKRVYIIKDIYRIAAKHCHPDKGGDTKWMQRINNAYDQLIKEKP